MKKKYRKVSILREVECEFDELKQGDVFRLIPIDDTDCLFDQDEFVLSVSDLLKNPFDKYDPKNSGIRFERISLTMALLKQLTSKVNNEKENSGKTETGQES